MTEPLHEASDLAAATAKVAHGGVGHGDNDPEATRALLVDKAIRDRQYPPIGEVETGLAMCAGWGPTTAPVAEPDSEAIELTRYLDMRRAERRAERARTPIVEPGLCTSTTVTADDAVRRCVLHAGHGDVHRDGPDPHTARGWTDDAPKPRTVRRDVASVTT